MLQKTDILYFTTLFHGFGILQHPDIVVWAHLGTDDDESLCMTVLTNRNAAL